LNLLQCQHYVWVLVNPQLAVETDLGPIRFLRDVNPFFILLQADPTQINGNSPI